MSNRYLFRGKKASDGAWVVGAFKKKSTVSLIYPSYCENELVCKVVDPKTIGQCTGLKDKNRKLAFESDKWKDDKGNSGVITWNKGACCFDFGIYGSVYDQEGCPMEDGEFEITGNIHDEN